MLCNQVAEAQSLVHLAHEDQAAIGGDPRSLELDLQCGVERELKGLVCGLTHWVSASAPSSGARKPASTKTFDATPASPGHNQIGNPGIKPTERSRGL